MSRKWVTLFKKAIEYVDLKLNKIFLSWTHYQLNCDYSSETTQDQHVIVRWERNWRWDIGNSDMQENVLDWSLCRPPPHLCIELLTWMWPCLKVGLWEVIRSWWWSPHEWDLCPYKKRHKSALSSSLNPPLLWGYSKKVAVCKPERGFSPDMGSADLRAV